MPFSLVKQSVLTVPCLLLPGFVAAGPLAEDNQYYAVQGSVMQIDGLHEHEEVDNALEGETFAPAILTARLGYIPKERVAVEARFGIGLANASIDVDGTDWSAEIDQLYGLYGVGYLPVGDWLSFYGVFGYTTVHGSVGQYSYQGKDVSYGGGVEIYLSEQIGVTLEGMQYVNESHPDIDVSAASAGVKITY